MRYYNNRINLPHPNILWMCHNTENEDEKSYTSILALFFCREMIAEFFSFTMCDFYLVFLLVLWIPVYLVA